MKTLLSLILSFFLATSVYGSTFTFAPAVALDLDSSNTVITNTTTETTVFTFSVPANMLATENRVRLKLLGIYTNTTVGDDNMTLRLKYGATTLLSVQIRLNSGEATARGVHVLAMLSADGATNSQHGHINIMVGETGTNGAGNTESGSSAEDSTTALNFVVTMELSVADANLTVTTQHAALTLVK